jgi:predicted phage terminase large subunit-like protein
MARRTPGRLAEYATEGRRYRTSLWRLFDRIALALVAGMFANVIIMCPPQHGKSEYWSKAFPAWYLGKNPNHRVVLCSYGAQFASSWGRSTRDLMRAHGPSLFGLTVREDVAAANEWKTAPADETDPTVYDGGMVTAGIEGGIAGRPAELAIADDLIADDDSAQSQVIKDKVWNFWENELCARLQKNGKRVMLMTRRAEDDPIGRILKLVEQKREDWKVIKLPAIAEENEDWPDLEWKRKAGEALCPELHPLAELESTRKALGETSHPWTGLRQQSPFPRGGGEFKSEWFKILEAKPPAFQRVRAWDLAYSENPNAKRTAGVLMSKRVDAGVNKYHIEDIQFGRWGSGRRNKLIVEQAKADGKGIPIVIEEEPGSGGPTQVDELVRLLDGWAVTRVKAANEGNKLLRADAMRSQAEVGNVSQSRGLWNDEFKNEINAFPNGKTKDMVDAAAHAYNFLAADKVATVPDDYAPGAGEERKFNGPTRVFRT